MIHIINNPIIKWIFFILLILVCILFFIGGPDYYSSRSQKSIWDQGHILFYTLLIIYLLQYWSWYASLDFYRQLAWSLVLTISTGIMIELVQIRFSRFPELGDIWRDILGCFLALIFFSNSIIIIHSKYLNIIKISIIFLILIEFSYPVKSVIDETVARKQFPILSGFETPFEIDRWKAEKRIKRNNQYSSEGKYSAQISLTTETYSGVSLIYFPRNWRDFKKLQFSVYNSLNEPLRITCRIHDWKHIENGQKYSDRFNKRFILQPGWNEIDIAIQEIQNAPMGRLMDLEKIYNFGFFTTNLKSPITIYLDDVKLEY